LLTEATTCEHEKTENSCALMLKHKEALWTFVDIEEVEPRNNFAEQLIRFYVSSIACKNGNRRSCSRS